MAYEPRSYRERMGGERFRSFILQEGETDLWIGCSREADFDGMKELARKKVRECRGIISSYIEKDPLFLHSLEPMSIHEGDPDLIKQMKAISAKSDTGPMSVVAGLIAEETGKYLMDKCCPAELVIENGGDNFLYVQNEILLSVDSGLNINFSNLSLMIPPEESPVGVCTSSGMFGHSMSFGKADSVTVVCKSAALADAWATAIANKIQIAEDVKKAMDYFNEEMLSLVCVKGDKMGIRGKLRLNV